MRLTHLAHVGQCCDWNICRRIIMIWRATMDAHACQPVRRTRTISWCDILILVRSAVAGIGRHVGDAAQRDARADRPVPLRGVRGRAAVPHRHPAVAHAGGRAAARRAHHAGGQQDDQHRGEHEGVLHGGPVVSVRQHHVVRERQEGEWSMGWLVFMLCRNIVEVVFHWEHSINYFLWIKEKHMTHENYRKTSCFMFSSFLSSRSFSLLWYNSTQ